MKKGHNLLLSRLGTYVQDVIVHVWLFSGDESGEMGEILIAFANRGSLALGCAGDGSVLITPGEKSVGNAPGMSTTKWKIPGLYGDLGKVKFGDVWLELEIGRRRLLLTNVDDQLEVAVDGEEMSRSIRQQRGDQPCSVDP